MNTVPVVVYAISTFFYALYYGSALSDVWNDPPGTIRARRRRVYARMFLLTPIGPLLMVAGFIGLIVSSAKLIFTWAAEENP